MGTNAAGPGTLSFNLPAAPPDTAGSRSRLLNTSRLKRRDKRIVETVHPFEVRERILLRLSKNSLFDQLINHFSKMLTHGYPPCFKNRWDHGAKIFERVLPDSLQQLPPTDMGGAKVSIFLRLLYRKFESIFQEKISITIEPWVIQDDEVYCGGKVNFLHGTTKTMSPTQMHCIDTQGGVHPSTLNKSVNLRKLAKTAID